MDHQSLNVKTPSTADQTKLLSTINVSGYAAKTYTLVYGGSYGTIAFDMKKTIITSNSFSYNYGGRNGAILILQGYPMMELNSNTFQYNGNNIPDFTILYSTIVLKVQRLSVVSGRFKDSSVTDTTLASYSNKMRAILKIEIANTLSISNMNFINNWVIDYSTSDAASHSILLENIYKSFSCTNCKFSKNKGISNDPILNEAATSVNFNSITRGLRVPLLNFNNYFFR